MRLEQDALAFDGKSADLDALDNSLGQFLGLVRRAENRHGGARTAAVEQTARACPVPLPVDRKARGTHRGAGGHQVAAAGRFVHARGWSLRSFQWPPALPSSAMAATMMSSFASGGGGGS